MPKPFAAVNPCGMIVATKTEDQHGQDIKPLSRENWRLLNVRCNVFNPNPEVHVAEKSMMSVKPATQVFPSLKL